jgi:hypothetical protein
MPNRAELQGEVTPSLVLDLERGRKEEQLGLGVLCLIGSCTVKKANTNVISPHGERDKSSAYDL